MQTEIIPNLKHLKIKLKAFVIEQFQIQKCDRLQKEIGRLLSRIALTSTPYSIRW